MGRIRRAFLFEGILAELASRMGSGALFVGYALSLGAQAPHIGLLSAAKFVGGVGQLGVGALVGKLRSRKKFCLLGLGFSWWTRFAVALLPFLLYLGVGRGSLLWLLLILYLVLNILGASVGVVRISWWGETLPSEEWGEFLGTRMLLARMFGIPVVLAASFFVDRWRSSHPDSLLIFQYVLGLGLIFGLAQILTVRTIPDAPPQGRPSSLPKRLLAPLRRAAYRRFLSFRIGWAFAVGFAADFFTLYMLKFLDMSFLWTTLVNVLGDMGSMGLARYWGKLADRFGARPVLVVGTCAKALFPLFWVWVMPGWWWVVFLVILVRCFNSAQQISVLQLTLKLSEGDEREQFIATDRALYHLFRALSPAVAALVAHNLDGWNYIYGPFRFEVLHILFFISFLLRLCSLGLLLRVPDSGASGTRYMLRKLAGG